MERREIAWGLSTHALDRLREFYPAAERGDARAAVEASEQIETDIGLRLVGRAGRMDHHKGEFRLHPERSGLFVVVGRTVVTFLRFYSLHQHKLAEDLYGEGEPVAEFVPWAMAVAKCEEVEETEEGTFGEPEVQQEVSATDHRKRRVVFSNGAAKALGGRGAAFKILVQTVVLDFAQDDSERHFTHDGRSFYLRAEGPRVRCGLRPDQALRVPWLDNLRAKQIQISPAAIRLLNQGERPNDQESSEIRRGVLKQLAEMKEPTRVGDRWRPVVCGETWWLSQLRNHNSRFWLLTHREPPEVAPAVDAAAQTLLDAGWRVKPPLWEDD